MLTVSAAQPSTTPSWAPQAFWHQPTLLLPKGCERSRVLANKSPKRHSRPSLFYSHFLFHAPRSAMGSKKKKGRRGSTNCCKKEKDRGAQNPNNATAVTNCLRHRRGRVLEPCSESTQKNYHWYHFLGFCSCIGSRNLSRVTYETRRIKTKSPITKLKLLYLSLGRIAAFKMHRINAVIC